MLENTLMFVFDRTSQLNNVLDSIYNNIETQGNLTIIILNIPTLFLNDTVDHIIFLIVVFVSLLEVSLININLKYLILSAFSYCVKKTIVTYTRLLIS